MDCKKLFCAVVVLCASGFAQNNLAPVPPVFLGPATAPRLGANLTITFCTSTATGAPCSPLAQAYADTTNNNPINQVTTPLKTDSLGNAPAFYAAPGQYSFTVTGPGIGAPQGPYQIIVPFLGGPSPWIDITGPGYGAKCDDSTDDTAAVQAVLNTLGNGTGGTMFIPPSANGCKITSAALTIPVDASSPIHKQKTIRIVGTMAGGLQDDFAFNATTCNGGSTLDMTFNAATAKILTLGSGKLEITGVCFKDTGTDNAPLLLTTNTVVHAYRNQFFMNCTAPSNDLFILGGLDLTAGNVATSDFQGYGTVIDSNQAKCIGRFALLQNTANAIQITNNHIFSPLQSGNNNFGAIELNPGASGNNNGNYIAGNLIEIFNYKYGVRLVQNSSYNEINGNGCFDGSAFSANCVLVVAGASNTRNKVVDANASPGGGFNAPSAVPVSTGNALWSETGTTGFLQVDSIQGPGFQKQVFTSSGTFTIPAGITQVKATVLGGGGSGAGAAANNSGTGGGSSGTCINWLTGLTPGNTITVTVGAGGTAVTNAAGNNGVASSISSGTQTISTRTSNPGQGGVQGSTAIGGTAGTTSGCDVAFQGATGGIAGGTAISGNGGASIFGGAGGGGATNNCTAASTASGSGGGASSNGASNGTSCAGAGGVVIFEWVN